MPDKKPVKADDTEGVKITVKTAPPLPDKLKTEPDEKPEATAVDTPAQPEAPGDTEPELLNNNETDDAVEDIAAKESDKLLAIDDAKRARQQSAAVGGGGGWKSKLKRLFKSKRTWAVIAVVLIALFAVPFTRYKILGLVVRQSVTVTVLDSTTSRPVSSAEVSIGGGDAKTDGDGHAQLKASVGPHDLKVTKQYYKDYSGAYFVGFKAGKDKTVKLVATGRQVPVTVSNRITGKPLADAEIQVLDTTARTDKHGKAVIVLPAKAAKYSAVIRLLGYGTTNVKVTVTDRSVKANAFGLVPAGHVYFLSNLGGSIDVVKSNLDGSGRKTILAGTGREDQNTTSLLASRDWRYLVLKARRDGSQPALYLIDTATDKVSQFDNTDADFELVGWHDHDFVYAMTKRHANPWQGGRQQLKSYDADNRQLNLLDQNQAAGKSSNYGQQQLLNFYIVDSGVVYNTLWQSVGGYDLRSAKDTIRSVSAKGLNKKDYRAFAANVVTYLQATLYGPNAIYVEVFTYSGQTSYYEFENQTVSAVALDTSDFNKAYPTYLVSPSGHRTFWTELRDGKNSLLTGDADGNGERQVATLDGYTPYGWYGDDYLLVSKGSSELYILPSSGLDGSRQPLKVTDYYKPTQTFAGYGYGYGGI